MSQRVEEIRSQKQPHTLWFLEHPNIYTLGSRGHESDFFTQPSCPVIRTDRGGQVTYHGPGQRVAYVMLNLNHFQKDLRWYIEQLQLWLQETLSFHGVPTFSPKDRVGIWTHDAQNKQVKLCSIGVKVRKWITFHGVAVNVNPELSYFKKIIPCGIPDFEVSSLQKINPSTPPLPVDSLDADLVHHFEKRFGLTCEGKKCISL